MCGHCLYVFFIRPGSNIIEIHCFQPSIGGRQNRVVGHPPMSQVLFERALGWLLINMLHAY
jgi:hypothetical protein